jgi:eukaryotic-like serine/threonine-protein kinase
VLRELRSGDPRLIGPYRLVGQLGDGGMGRVFLGRSAGGRPVAVKVIRSELAADPDFRARFRREVAAARKVNGLFTAMVIDADVDAPEPWLATAYVDGPSLSEAIHDHGPLPVSSVLALAAGLAESLAAIHAAGVVHRDLKPSNVLLARDGPHVIDFGISRAVEATSLTRAGFVIGSPGFMSPEQAEGNEVGPSSDIFSLGAVLAFAASGDPPFGTGSTAALVYRIVHAAPRLDGVPEEIRPLIERCLAKDPGQRPAASELLSEAEAVQPTTGWLPEPITRAFPDSPAQGAAEPPPPAVGAEELSDSHPTVTGESTLTTSESGTVPPAEAVSEQSETSPRDAESVPPGEQAEAALAPDETVRPPDEVVVPDAETVPEKEEAATSELPASRAHPGLEPEPEAAVMPRAVGDLPRRQRHLSVRSLVLGSAAAVILIGSAAAGLALASSGHTSAPHGRATVAAIAQQTTSAPAQPATSQPSPSAARTSPRSSARPSKGPSAQPTTADTTAQASTTQPATSGPAAESSPKPTTESTSKPKPTPKPTHTQTQPTTYSVRVSGGSEDSCGDEGSVHPSSGASVQFSFVDNSSANVQIASIDTTGAVEWYATLIPGASAAVGTNVGAYWVVENSGGGCLAVVGVNGGGEAVIT